MRVLVTGGTGFVGRHTLAPLLAKGYEVHLAGNRIVQEPIEGVTYHQADLLDPCQMEQVVKEVRAAKLMHFAWYVEPKIYLTSYKNVQWISATMELLRLFAEHGGSRAVLAGTCFEYDLHQGFLNEAQTPAEPDSLYGTCKNSLRQVAQSYAEQHNISLAWGRIFFLYGPHEYASRLVASVTNALLRGEDAKCSHGRQVRDFMHVQDVADAFVALMESPVTGTVNIASGAPTTLKDIVMTLAALTGGEALVKMGTYPSPENEPPVILADTRRLNQEVGWKPSMDLQAGLADTVAWWRAHLEVREPSA
ncbi:MAG: nucleoside-diphosphate-sugar epimerase [Kiritimatiellia bacterium]|jgi:nucleoside-diphosphate-sugar epimerase